MVISYDESWRFLVFQMIFISTLFKRYYYIAFLGLCQ